MLRKHINRIPANLKSVTADVLPDFSPNQKRKTKPRRKSPTADWVRAVVETQQHNPTWVVHILSIKKLDD